MNKVARCEAAVLWAVLAIGGAVLACFAWNVAVTDVEPRGPAPEALPSEGNRHSLTELASAPVANANNTAVRLASRGRLDQAVEYFRYALRTDPQYVPGHKNLLAALVESERWPEALAAAREAEDVHPLGKYLKAEVRSQKAEVSGQQTAVSSQRSVRRTANSEPRTANGEAQTGRSAEDTEGSGDAATDTGKPRLKSQASGLKPAARVRVPDDPEVRAALYEERDFIANCARAYLENGLLEEAEARYLLHVQLCPNEFKGYNALAELALRRGQPERRFPS
jgi:tetratricopeptide (TPR) repeat protein